MHTHSSSSPHKRPRLQTQEIAHILDPYYHIDPAKCSPASPCPSMLSFRSADSTTWTDATGGKHDPDFRPFATASTSSHRHMSFASLPRSPPTSYSPRSSFDYPASPDLPSSSSMTPPSKAARNAARRELHPDFRRAIKAHERDLAKERKASWLKRRRTSDEYAAEDEQSDDDDAVAVAAYSPPPLPELVLDDGSDADDDDDAQDADGKSATHRDHLRRHFASLSLRVDLAVFRAKKHLRGRLGLD